MIKVDAYFVEYSVYCTLLCIPRMSEWVERTTPSLFRSGMLSGTVHSVGRRTKWIVDFYPMLLKR